MWLPAPCGSLLRAQCSKVKLGLVFFGLVWFSLVGFDLFGLVWFDFVLFGTHGHHRLTLQ